MCGISGLFQPRLSGAERAREIARMTATLAHRGPDGGGVWNDADAPISFGHRRLAIVDLSEAGAQPMLSADGRFALTFNGEIYNHLDLRARLESGGAKLRGDSDTEALLETIARDGLDEALKASVGMFALALWDRAERTLHLARDRMGEKPLYYGYVGGGAFAFASEVQALRAYDGFSARVSRDAVATYLRYGYVSGPLSIFEGVFKLRAGHVLTLTERMLAGGELSERRPFWTLHDAIGARDSDSGRERSDDEWVDEVETTLKQAVLSQMRADVPLGAFLSGGVDSTAVVSLMQELSARPVKTFTIGFDRQGFDEAPHARAIAERLGTDHAEHYVSCADALAEAETIAGIYDEPFADSSQIPTSLVSKLARQQVTVVLSGDGGDELFGGYNRYVLGDRLWRRMRATPLAARKLAARAIFSASPGRIDDAAAAARRFLPGYLRVGGAGDRLHKLARALESRTSAELYASFISVWPEGPAAMRREAEDCGRETAPSAHERFACGAPLADAELALAERIDRRFAELSFPERMMAMDSLTYLPGDILVKVDRASMAQSLEARVPMLDHRLVELAWRVPTRLKIRDGRGKWILRQVVGRRIPLEIMNRPKAGFAIPLDRWLRGPLRAWAESLLDARAINKHNLLDAASVRRTWEEHLSGRWNRQNEAWCALMLQSWLDQRPARPSEDAVASVARRPARAAGTRTEAL